MRALILAAGRGERLRPLTDTLPKPLLFVGGRRLIEWQLLALARAGVRDVVVNTAWLEEQFPAALGDGSRWGVSIRYSTEGAAWGGALETAGGIAAALPLLAPDGDEPFWAVSGDVLAPDFDFAAAHVERYADGAALGHLWLVPNPPYHAHGDFTLGADGRVGRDGERAWTYANIALLRPALVAGIAPGTRAALGPLLFTAAAAGRLTGEPLAGRWFNVGSAAELAAARAAVSPPGPA